eukprot:TRINITY_DN2538_c0_g1_i3.p1 TRINITY_DN2538_c0_g1~~TRINITY_DN2538_c0_g1_i3.p1  ORF type:complete len:459 (-),score=116.12 TRINITY_DN2538_c0_g1_i3:32-1408(-)
MSFRRSVDQTNSSVSTPYQPLQPTQWNLYGRRWYLLVVYSMISCQQSIIWITFSPVAEATKSFFGVSDAGVNLLLAWGPIIYIPFLFFTGFILNIKGGLRKTLVIAAILDGIAGPLRCLALINPQAWWAIYVVSLAQILNAAAGPMVMATPSKFSATWFGENERTTVTSIATTANSLGGAIGFIYSPYVVKYLSLPWLLIIQGIQCVVVMIWIIAYFPEKPPMPPSASAAQHEIQVENPVSKKSGFFREFLSLCLNPNFVLFAMIGGVSQGAFSAWSGMFDLILGPLGYSPTFAGWIGFASSIAGIIGGILVGILGDTLFKRKFKWVILVLLFLSTVLCLFFTLSLPSFFSTHPLIPNSYWSIVLSIIFAGLFVGSAAPLFLELGAEITFPISEGSSAAVITLVNNLASLLLLIVGPLINRNWINFIAAVCIGASTLATFFVRESYKRKDYDDLNTDS